MKSPKKRTTVMLDEAVLREAKQLAASRSVSLSKLVEDALRVSAAEQSRPRRPFKLHSVPGGKLQPGVDLTNNAELLALMDEGVPLEKLR